MRSDIVPGGVFPDYELPDHTETLRKLSEIQGDDPADSHARARPLLPEGAPAASGAGRVSTRKSLWRTHKSLRSLPTSTIRFRSFVLRLGRSGRSSPTLSEKFRRISTFRSTPTRTTIR